MSWVAWKWESVSAAFWNKGWGGILSRSNTWHSSHSPQTRQTCSPTPSHPVDVGIIMLSQSLSPTGKSNIWTFHCWFAALWLRGSALLKSWQPDGENSVADFATAQLRCAICCEWEWNFYKCSAEQELSAQVMQHTGPFTRVRCGIWVSGFQVN